MYLGFAFARPLVWLVIWLLCQRASWFTESVKPQVGALIEARRVELRLTMRSAARACGLSATTWSDVESGKRPPGVSTQRAMAQALSWPLDWLEYVQRGETPAVSQSDDVAALRAQVAELSDRVKFLQRAVDGLLDVATGRASTPAPAPARPSAQGS